MDSAAEAALFLSLFAFGAAFLAGAFFAAAFGAAFFAAGLGAAFLAGAFLAVLAGASPSAATSTFFSFFARGPIEGALPSVRIAVTRITPISSREPRLRFEFLRRRCWMEITFGPRVW